MEPFFISRSFPERTTPPFEKPVFGLGFEKSPVVVDCLETNKLRVMLGMSVDNQRVIENFLMKRTMFPDEKDVLRQNALMKRTMFPDEKDDTRHVISDEKDDTQTDS
ncbi:MAG: hypothetical protein V4726_00070 [Verrucomicrobiota bacterium]